MLLKINYTFIFHYIKRRTLNIRTFLPQNKRFDLIIQDKLLVSIRIELYLKFSSVPMRDMIVSIFLLLIPFSLWFN